MNGTSESQRIVVDGELTIFTAAEIRERLLVALDGAGPVEVDLSGVAEMDTAGLQVILASRLEAARRKVGLAFVSPSQVVADVMALYGLGEDFAVPPPGAGA